MPAATVGRVEIRASVPRTLGGPAVQRLESALGRPLADAVPAAFALLEQVDPGAYWVLREVPVDVRIPAAEPDPARSAARIARAMAAAVERVVHYGPAPDAVRFGGRAAYVAAFIGIVLDGGTGGWVFDRLRMLGGLPAPDAVVAAARAVDTDLLTVVDALVSAGRWTRLITTARAAELARLDAAIGREAIGPAGAAVRSTVRNIRLSGTVGGAAVRRASRAVERRLWLLGEVSAAGFTGPAAAAAVWSAEPAPPAEPPSVTVTGPDAPPVRVPLAEASGLDPVDDRPCHPEEIVQPPIPARLSAPGAAAFLLVPDLDDLLPAAESGAALAGTARAAGDARAWLLAAVLGRDVGAGDAAVRLAAGAEPYRPDGNGDDFRELIDGLEDWSAALDADEIFGWEHPGDTAWFAALAARHERLVPVARALLRRFAAHLPGFGHAGAAFLAERTLALDGSVRLDEDVVVVELPRPPLHVLLGLAGLDAFTYRCRWLDIPVVVVHEGD